MELVQHHSSVGEAVYSISKAALNMVVAKYAAHSKVAGDGLTFLAISPGLVRTDALKGAGNVREYRMDSIHFFLILNRTLFPATSDRTGAHLHGCNDAKMS